MSNKEASLSYSASGGPIHYSVFALPNQGAFLSIQLGPASYQSMKAALPMDAELIDTALKSAAKSGVLIDEQGDAIPPIKSKSLLDILFKR
ncbi:hypothetical protein GCM10025791_44770 [Halioxenophilus aromaticivorans]|uniref:Uncharacterized protein n=1 Tax=Halioxenophilus aromaticivorans TaxID=1306992 RepID=A0AAV3U8L5_9ALTE